MGPRELCELEAVMAFLERGNEEDESWMKTISPTPQIHSVRALIHTHHVKHKANKSMMCCKGQEHAVDQHDMLEVINDALAI